MSAISAFHQTFHILLSHQFVEEVKRERLFLRTCYFKMPRKCSVGECRSSYENEEARVNVHGFPINNLVELQ